MSMNDGGSAFPRNGFTYMDSHGLTRVHDNSEGMSLRDWFAGQALIGLLANHHSDGDYDTTPISAYRMADAMLAERKKGGAA